MKRAEPESTRFSVPPHIYLSTMDTDRPEKVRSLHLVDIENLLGDPFCEDTSYFDETVDEYKELADWRATDQVLIAANRWLSKRIAFSLESWNCRLFTAEGQDGADLRLLSEGAQPKLIEQFDRLVVGSGDAIFCKAISSAKALSLEAITVSRKSSLSSRLANESDKVLTMSESSSAA